MIFSKDEAAQVRAGKQTAKLMAVDSLIGVGRVTPMMKRFQRHDADGEPLDWTTEPVEDVSGDGDRWPVLLTVLSVRGVWVGDLTQKDAEACGYRSAATLREAWDAEGLVRSTEVTARLVHFTIGDIRDRDRYLARPGAANGDYTQNRHRAIDDLPALPFEQLAPITKLARETDRLRCQEPEQLLRDGLIRQLEAYELAERKPSRHVQSAIRAIRHQVRSLDRRLNEAA